jgi:trehalose-phosphatase
VVSPAMHRALLLLARRRHINVRVISGRRWADVNARIHIARIPCFGLHGWEVSPARSFRPEISERMRRLRLALGSSLPLGREFWIEDKEFTIVLHFRAEARHRIFPLRSALRKILAGFGPGVRILENKGEWELLPAEIKGKGSAVQSIIRRDRTSKNALVIYLGDDVSDESAFRILPRGITVRVGRSSPTFARFRLDGPSQVRQFLKKLVEELP